MYNLINFFIIALSVPGVWLVNSDRLKWGTLLMLLAQPFWLLAILLADPVSIGMLVMGIIYTVAWSRGFYHHWIRG